MNLNTSVVDLILIQQGKSFMNEVKKSVLVAPSVATNSNKKKKKISWLKKSYKLCGMSLSVQQKKTKNKTKGKYTLGHTQEIQHVPCNQIFTFENINNSNKCSGSIIK